MSNEQGKSSMWTDKELSLYAEAIILERYGIKKTYEVLCQVRDAWQADHDALSAKLDAAQQRIAELKGQVAIYIREEIDHEEWLSPLVRQDDVREAMRTVMELAKLRNNEIDRPEGIAEINIVDAWLDQQPQDNVQPTP